MLLHRIISLCTALLFSFQASAHSFGVLTPESRLILEKIVGRYNSFSLEERRSELQAFISELPAQDQQELSKRLGDLSTVTFPDLKLDEDKVTIPIKDSEYILKIGLNHKVEYKGVQVDVAPGNLSKASQQFEDLLRQKHTGLLNFLIPSAHADFLTTSVLMIVGFVVMFASLLVVGIAAPILAVGGGLIAVGAILYDMYELKNVPKYCSETKKKILESRENFTSEDIVKMKAAIKEAKIKLMADKKCNERGITKDSRQPICAETLKCLDQLAKELHSSNSINNSERGSVKDIHPSGSKKPVREAASEQ